MRRGAFWKTATLLGMKFLKQAQAYYLVPFWSFLTK